MLEVLYWIFVFLGVWYFILNSLSFILKRVSYYLIKRAIKNLTAKMELNK